MRILRALLLLGLVTGYLLPWITVNEAASLTLNAYDLAEWVSLHPEVRAQPFLLTSLLLRLPLVFTALLITLSARSMLLAAFLIIGIAVALLPPAAFITNIGDPNYGQQLALSLATLLGGLAGLLEWVRRRCSFLTLVVIVVGALVTFAGYAQAYDLMRGFQLNAQVGAGVVVTLGIYAGLLLDSLISESRQPHRLPLLRRARIDGFNSFAR